MLLNILYSMFFYIYGLNDKLCGRDLFNIVYYFFGMIIMYLNFEVLLYFLFGMFY